MLEEVNTTSWNRNIPAGIGVLFIRKGAFLLSGMGFLKACEFNIATSIWNIAYIEILQNGMNNSSNILTLTWNIPDMTEFPEPSLFSAIVKGCRFVPWNVTGMTRFQMRSLSHLGIGMSMQ